MARIELLYLLAFALTVALGLRDLGVLLMGSLVIIPAVGRNALLPPRISPRTERGSPGVRG